MSSIKFLGATGVVTGSKYLLTANGRTLLIDCGLFQGYKGWRQKNWEPFPLSPKSIDWIALTHAHLDHTGYIPRIVKEGYRNGILATSATVDLCGLLLPDSGHLQEEEAKFANKKGFSKHSPALPLYTADEARASLRQFCSVEYKVMKEIDDTLSLRFLDAGHILGSSIVEVFIRKGGDRMKVVFSGDIGRFSKPILNDPTSIHEADYLLIESTYGDRLHASASPKDELERVVNDTYDRNGVLLIPSFAVGRTQDLLYTLRELEKEHLIPSLPIYVDSPMAIDATHVFCRHPKDHNLDSKKLMSKHECPLMCNKVHMVTTAEGSKALNDVKIPTIIIAGSGMVTGGRILHHLANRLSSPKTTVLFVGYQGEGTRGRALLDGAETLKIHGQYVPVKAKIEQISGFSGHADYAELLKWLKGFERPPKQTFIVHGEDRARHAFAGRIKSELGWNVVIPNYEDSIELNGEVR